MITEDQFFEMEMDMRRTLPSFNSTYLFETFPEALDSINFNIHVLTKKMQEIIAEPTGPHFLSLILLWPLAEHLASLKKLLWRYSPPPIRSGSITPRSIVIAKEHPFPIDIPRSGFVKCPFHNERTASCKITKDHFHCFGCGEHGDVIDWIMKTENKDFVTVVKQLS